MVECVTTDQASSVPRALEHYSLDMEYANALALQRFRPLPADNLSNRFLKSAPTRVRCCVRRLAILQDINQSVPSNRPHLSHSGAVAKTVLHVNERSDSNEHGHGRRQRYDQA